MRLKLPGARVEELRCLAGRPFYLPLRRLAPAGVAPQLKRDPLGGITAPMTSSPSPSDSGFFSAGQRPCSVLQWWTLAPWGLAAVALGIERAGAPPPSPARCTVSFCASLFTLVGYAGTAPASPACRSHRPRFSSGVCGLLLALLGTVLLRARVCQEVR